MWSKKPLEFPVLAQLGFVCVSADTCQKENGGANVICLGYRHDRLLVPERFKVGALPRVICNDMELPASWHPEMPYRTRHGLLVFEIDDSERHWFAAHDENEAFHLFVTTLGYTEQGYLDDYDERPEMVVLCYGKLKDKTVRYEDDRRKVPMRDIADEMVNPGMIASTCW